MGKELKAVRTEHFKLNSVQVDFKKQIRINSLTHILQEAAGIHAEHLGFGYENMRSKGLVWMLSRMLIRINEYPRWEDDVSITTWPKGLNRLFYMRDYKVTDSSGKELAVATSYWLLINLKSRRPKIYDEHRAVMERMKDHHAMEEPVENLREAVPDEVFRHKTKYSEFDMNEHVNSNRYAEWIMDTFSPGWHKNNNVRHIQLSYLNEIKFNEEITINKEHISESEHLFEGIKSDGKSCFRARVVWGSEQ